MMTPQLADWLEGAKDASDQARRVVDPKRRVQAARRAANLWDRTARTLLARKDPNWTPEIAVYLRLAAAEWTAANNRDHALEDIALAASLDKSLGPPRIVYSAKLRAWGIPWTPSSPPVGG
jgi:hypothetical protein